MIKKKLIKPYRTNEQSLDIPFKNHDTDGQKDEGFDGNRQK